jgi:hypothetical protein
MSYDNEWLEEILAARHKSIEETARPATLEEVKQLGSERFPAATDPWAESYQTFLVEHPRGNFYLARTSDGADVVYCRDAEKGIWFLPGKGMGILQPKGLRLMAEIVDAL